MIAVHRPAIGDTLWKGVKMILPLMFAALAAAPSIALAQDDEAREVYDSFLTCAAFHTIEATRSQGNAAAAQQASAVDYATAAAAFVNDGKRETVDADLKQLLESYQTQLQNGEPRVMAEQWTALETSCAELHPLKEKLVERRKTVAAQATPKDR